MAPTSLRRDVSVGSRTVLRAPKSNFRSAPETDIDQQCMGRHEEDGCCSSVELAVLGTTAGAIARAT
jgi:hypothetical protein